MTMHPNFVYLSWDSNHRNKNLHFANDNLNTVAVKTSVGVYKNNYADFVF